MTEPDWTYVAFDPGVTTGIACWDETCKERTGQPVHVGMVNEEDLDDFLEIKLPGRGTKVFIIEEYRILPSKLRIHSGSKVPTIQVIGQLKSYARRKKIELVEQPTSILPMAQLQSGVKLSKNHANSHWASAYNHGYFYLRQKGLIESRSLRDN
jgi:hypothetical protein